MTLLPGVYIAKKKDGTIYYRSSITYKNKHISLGSYSTEQEANEAYTCAQTILNDSNITIDDYTNLHPILDFVLINFRDNLIYIKTPIYLRKKYFLYYFSSDFILKFDVDDLFYYSNHKIMKRGNHLFVADYGMQVNIQNRYGIRNFAVLNRDYYFKNGDSTDYRYGNIVIVNRYYGVQRKNHGITYEAKIHINGDYLIGVYKSEIEAAIAYNKAVLLLKQKNVAKNFPLNYIDEINEIEYASILNRVRISNKIREYQVSDSDTKNIE